MFWSEEVGWHCHSIRYLKMLIFDFLNNFPKRTRKLPFKMEKISLRTFLLNEKTYYYYYYYHWFQIQCIHPYWYSKSIVFFWFFIFIILIALSLLKNMILFFLNREF